MKIFIFLIFVFSLNVFSNEVKEETFSSFSGGFKLSSVNHSFNVISFSGKQIAKGEVVFEVVTIDDYENDIYRVNFIPEEPSLFPYVSSGFYAKKLFKIALLNHSKAKDLLFTDEEWKKSLSTGETYISKNVEIEIHNYATSVECDSRHYYAEILNIKSPTQLVQKAKERKELWGC